MFTIFFKILTNRLSSLFFSVYLTACSPTLDWRTSQLSGHSNQYALTFPGKALTAQKNVLLGDAQHILTLHGVQAGDTQFVLGIVPANNAVQAERLAHALAGAFENNLSTKAKLLPATVNKALGAFDATYPSAERFAQARFIWTSTAAYELLVLSTAKDLSAETVETADTFIRSMKFE